jgi:flavodoxin
MKKALIVYRSKTGTTFRFGEEIKGFLEVNQVESDIIDIDEFSPEALEGIDFLFLGCWTSGWMICKQHPDQEWVEFASNLPDLGNITIGLFTTYKLATGSMFRKMKSHLKVNPNTVITELKSRNGLLKESDTEVLMNLIKP